MLLRYITVYIHALISLSLYLRPSQRDSTGHESYTDYTLCNKSVLLRYYCVCIHAYLCFCIRLPVNEMGRTIYYTLQQVYAAQVLQGLHGVYMH